MQKFRQQQDIHITGRGQVQLTWEENYRKTGDLIGLDLVNNPDLMLDPRISARVMIEGIIDGRFNGRGKGVAFYLPDSGPDDLKNARRTVNITDKWQLIGGYYKKFLEAIGEAGGVPTLATQSDDVSVADDISASAVTEIDDRETVRASRANPDSRLLPTHRPRQKAAVTLATLQKFSHLLPAGRKDDAVYVVGIRGYYTDYDGRWRAKRPRPL